MSPTCRTSISTPPLVTWSSGVSNDFTVPLMGVAMRTSSIAAVRRVIAGPSRPSGSKIPLWWQCEALVQTADSSPRSAGGRNNIATLYEQGGVHHVGGFAELETQMTTWSPPDDRDSPDRVDALVWGAL